MMQKLLFITVGNENNQDVATTHGGRSLVENQRKRGWAITEKVFEKDNLQSLSQENIENIFILGHGTEVGIGDDTPKAFAKKFAQKFNQNQRKQVKHLYVYACGLGQVIGNNCKAKQLADGLHQQGFEGITVHTITSPPDIEPGAEMISAIYSRIGVFGNNLEVGGGYSSWKSKAAKDTIETNNRNIERLTNEKAALNKQVQSPATKNKVEVFKQIDVKQQEISKLRRKNSQLQSGATYFAKTNDLIQEMQQPHNQFSKAKPLAENTQQAMQYYSKAAKTVVSEDDLNKQFAIEAIKQRIESLKEKAEKATNQEGKYMAVFKKRSKNITKNKSQRAERLEKLLKDIATNQRWKDCVRKASEDKIFQNIATRAKSKFNKSFGVKLPDFIPQDRTKQLLGDILDDRYPSKAVAAVNAELNPTNPIGKQAIHQKDLSSDSDIETANTQPTRSKSKKTSIRRMGVKVLPKETSAHVGINKHDSSSDSETDEAISTSKLKASDKTKNLKGFNPLARFTSKKTVACDESSSDSDNEASSLLSKDHLRPEMAVQSVNELATDEQVKQWLKDLRLDEQAKDVEGIRDKKAAQLSYFDQQLNKANFSTEQLIYLTKVLHQFQLTGDKGIVGNNFDLIRTERNPLRRLDINHGNTSSWQRMCHGVKETLMTNLKDEHASKDNQKTMLPATVYEQTEKVLRQRTGRFLSSSSFFKTSSIRDFYNRFDKETQGLLPSYNTHSKK